MASKLVNVFKERDKKLGDFHEEKDKRLCAEGTIKNTKSEKCNYVVRNFGFCKVSWVIKNYCLMPDKSKYCSPEFYVGGFHLTKWMIILERSYNVDMDKYEVLFQLKRLRCEYIGEATVYCLFNQASNKDSEITMDDCIMFFDAELATDHKSYVLTNSDFWTADSKNHPAIFEFKLDIFVSFPGIVQTIPPCKNTGIRELSENLGNLYDRINAPNSDCEDISTNAVVRLHIDSLVHLKVHRAIVFYRIRNEDYRKRVREVFFSRINMEDFLLKPLDKLLKFLYTGNLQVVLEPDMKVFKYADFFGVKEILDYYNPDEIHFTSLMDLEEYRATWTIEDFCSRNDYFLVSPIMVNKTMDMKWRIQIYPNGRENGSEYVGIVLKCEVTTPKFICVEFSMESGSENRISYKCDEIIDVDKSIDANFIKLGHVRDNFMRDDSFTLSLQLRISNDEEIISIDESKTGHKHLSEQKSYERLSEDVLSAHENNWLPDLVLELNDRRITIHKFILYARCNNLRTKIKDYDLDYLNNMNPFVFDQLVLFLYSGKIKDNISLEAMISLCKAAIYYDFQNLALVIIEKLHDLLSESNAKTIYDFVNSLHVSSLQGPVQNLLEKINF